MPPLGALKKRTHKQSQANGLRLRQMADVSSLLRMGYTQNDVAAKLGITQARVNYLALQITKEYNATILKDRKEIAARESDVLMDVRRLAYEAFLRSGEDAQTIVEETQGSFECRSCMGTGAGKGEHPLCKQCNGTGLYTPPPKLKKILQGKVPAGEYLKIILDTTKQMRELYGLDEATKVSLVDDQGRNVFGMVYDALSRSDPTQDRLAKEQAITSARASGFATLAKASDYVTVQARQAALPARSKEEQDDPSDLPEA